MVRLYKERFGRESAGSEAFSNYVTPPQAEERFKSALSPAKYPL